MPWRFRRGSYRPAPEQERKALHEHLDDLRAELSEVEEQLRRLEGEPSR
jgi:hypothetical protein